MRSKIYVIIFVNIHTSWSIIGKLSVRFSRGAPGTVLPSSSFLSSISGPSISALMTVFVVLSFPFSMRGRMIAKQSHLLTGSFFFFFFNSTVFCHEAVISKSQLIPLDYNYYFDFDFFFFWPVRIPGFFILSGLFLKLLKVFTLSRYSKTMFVDFIFLFQDIK